MINYSPIQLRLPFATLVAQAIPESKAYFRFPELPPVFLDASTFQRGRNVIKLGSDTWIAYPIGESEGEILFDIYIVAADIAAA